MPSFSLMPSGSLATVSNPDFSYKCRALSFPSIWEYYVLPFFSENSRGLYIIAAHQLIFDILYLVLGSSEVFIIVTPSSFLYISTSFVR